MNIIYQVARFINRLIYKSPKRIIFMSRPDFSDNSKIFYDYMKTVSSQELIWLCFDKKVVNSLLKQEIKAIYLKSFKGMLTYLTSKYIVTSSSTLWQIKSKNQKQYDLWHGVLIKNLLNLEPGISPKAYADSVDMRFATSALTRALLAASFHYYPQKIAVTGHPRSDALKERGHLASLFPEQQGKKQVLYMPTYRQGYKDKAEGRIFNSSNVFFFESFDQKRFDEFLKREGIHLMVKLHPFEEKLFKKGLGQISQISLITHEMLYERGLDTYQLLGDIDILMTDYSSVYIDYLLVDRPIVFIPTDLSMYEHSRGFMIEPYQGVTPGDKVTSQEALERALCSEDFYQGERQLLRNMTHRFLEGSSCERIFKTIENSLN